MLDFRLRQAMTVGRHHADRIGFQNQERAIQCVARLFGRDGEVCLGDQRRQYCRRQFRQRMREGGNRRKVALLHADHLVGFAVGDNLHPVIFKQLETQLTLRQQAHKFKQLLRWNGSRTLALDLGFTARADRKLQVGRRQRQAVALRFKK